MNDDETRQTLKRTPSVQKPSREVLLTHMDVLTAEARELDSAIQQLEKKGITEPLTIRRLKKKKLNLRDQIARIEDELEPDLITNSQRERRAPFADNEELGYDAKNNNKKRNYRGNLEGDERPLVQRSLRLSEDLLLEVEAAAKASGISQQEWMRRQFKAALEGFEQPEPSGASVDRHVEHEGLSTTMKVPKKQMNLRLEPTVLEAVAKAVEEAGVPRNDWLRAAVIKALVEGLDVYETLEPERKTDVDFEP